MSDLGYFIDKYQRVRRRTVELCRPLETEDFVAQPVVDVSPPKWHLGHTTWFFEHFVLTSGLKGYTSYDKDFCFLFNSYYESVGERVQRHQRGFLTRPGVAEVMRYREHVDRYMLDFLSSISTVIPPDLVKVLELGLQHEQQHQELLVYDIKAILGHNPIYPQYIGGRDAQPSVEVGPSRYHEIPAGLYEIGHTGQGFAFDNEQGAHQVYLHPFRIMDRLVTNGEYLEFMESGGYDDFKYWLSEGWDWVNRERAEAPEYWQKEEDWWYCYQLRGGRQKVDLQAPVTHINYFEADAYATWKGMRLPTEFEWEVACNHKLLNDSSGANLAEKDLFEPVPALGHSQVLGDVWEWTGSAYLPYPYYSVAEGALGEYNGKFMVNQMVLRGGSCATPKDHIRTTYRNFFHPHLKWLFSGLRLAESL